MPNSLDSTDDDSSMDRRLGALREGLDASPHSLPIDALMPVLVPSSFFAHGNWPGPHEDVGIDGVGLTWAIELPEQTMRYLDHSIAGHWSALGIDWRERAFDNLSNRSHPIFATACFPRDEDQDPPFALVFMHDDGFGPSRLLFDDALSECFPEGYRIAMPEMSCGIAVSLSASDAEIDPVAFAPSLLPHCFSRGAAGTLRLPAAAKQRQATWSFESRSVRWKQKSS